MAVAPMPKFRRSLPAPTWVGKEESPRLARHARENVGLIGRLDHDPGGGWLSNRSKSPGTTVSRHDSGASKNVYQVAGIALKDAGPLMGGRVVPLSVVIWPVREIKSGFRRLSETATRELLFRSAVVNTAARSYHRISIACLFLFYGLWLFAPLNLKQ